MKNTLEAQEDARLLMRLLVDLGRQCPLRDPFAEAAEVTQLTPAQFHALMWLGHDGELTMGELARRIGVTEKTVTGIVDRLEKRGFVCRERSARDRRVVQVSLTREGQLTWKSLDERIFERTTTFLSALSKEDRCSLLRIVETLIESLKAHVSQS